MAILKRMVCVILILFFAVGAIMQRAGPNRIELEEVLSIGSLADDLLYQWVGIASDEFGNVYLTDTMDYSIKKFDSEGTLVKSAGKKGQGPGEFLAPRLVEWRRDCLYVTDQFIPGIQVFDMDLEFSHRIPVSYPVASFKVLPGGRIAAVTLRMRGSQDIYILDRTGHIEEKITYSREDDSLMMNMIDFEIDGEGNFFLVYIFQDRIEKLDGQGRRLWRRNLLDIKTVKKKKVASLEVPTEVVYKDIALDSRGRIYILGGQFSRNRSRDVYVLDTTGRLQASFSLPDTSHCIHIDGRDYLYARANDGVTLKKYSMRLVDGN